MRRWLALSLCLCAACAGDDDDANFGRLSLFTERGGVTLDCAAIDDLGALSLTITDAAGVVIVSERAISCGGALPELPAATYRLRVEAREGALLRYQGETTAQLPAEELPLALIPTQAYVQLGWSLSKAADCAAIAVELTPEGEQARSFRFGCAESPQWLAGSVSPARARVRVSAEDADGLVSARAHLDRVLLSGDNELQVALLPLDVGLSVDWSFSVGEQLIRACDDARVGVSELTATARDDIGGVLAEERILCASARPYLLDARFSPGEPVELELRASGAEHRFRGRGALEIGASSRAEVQLCAAGTVSLSVEATEACAGATRVSLRRDGETASTEVELEAGVTEASVELCYGSYELSVATEACSVTTTRQLAASEARWAPVILD